MDERQILDRAKRAAMSVAGPDRPYDSLLLRRDRHRRNQRITAGVVGLAVFVAAVWIVTSVASLDRTETRLVPGGSGATGPTVNGSIAEPTSGLGPVTPEDLTLGDSFMDAWADGNGEAAAAMFAPGGTFEGLQPAMLAALHDWFHAEGWSFGTTGCGIHGYGPQRGVVGCGFHYENDLTRALGLPPVDTTLQFVVGDGGIEFAGYGAGGDFSFDMFAGFRGREDVLGPVWDTFIDWIASSHPGDLGRMYDAGRDYPILDAASIDLWDRYTDEFIASPEVQALARSIRDAGWDGVGVPPEGTPPSLPIEGELVDGFDAQLGRAFAFVYADGRVIWTGVYGRDVANERRLTPDGVDLVRSGAVDAERFALSGSPVPEDGWADAEARPYVPSRYAVCFYKESGHANPGTVNDGYEYPSTVLRSLPVAARAILQGKDHTYPGDPGPIVCSGVTTEDVRALNAILEDVRLEDAEGDAIYVETNPLLPHGDWVRQGG